MSEATNTGTFWTGKYRPGGVACVVAGVDRSLDRALRAWYRGDSSAGEIARQLQPQLAHAHRKGWWLGCRCVEPPAALAIRRTPLGLYTLVRMDHGERPHHDVACPFHRDPPATPGPADGTISPVRGTLPVLRADSAVVAGGDRVPTAETTLAQPRWPFLQRLLLTLLTDAGLDRLPEPRAMTDLYQALRQAASSLRVGEATLRELLVTYVPDLTRHCLRLKRRAWPRHVIPQGYALAWLKGVRTCAGGVVLEPTAGPEIRVTAAGDPVAGAGPFLALIRLAGQGEGQTFVAPLDAWWTPVLGSGSMLPIAGAGQRKTIALLEPIRDQLPGVTLRRCLLDPDDATLWLRRGSRQVRVATAGIGPARPVDGITVIQHRADDPDPRHGREVLLNARRMLGITGELP